MKFQEGEIYILSPGITAIVNAVAGEYMRIESLDRGWNSTLRMSDYADGAILAPYAWIQDVMEGRNG